MKDFLITFFSAILLLGELSSSEDFSLHVQEKTTEFGINLVEKYQEPRIDFYSFFDKKSPTALSFMKEMRLERKKTSSPYAQDKVVYIFNENDVIFETYQMPLAEFSSSYEISRLVKKDDGYLIISYKIKGSRPTQDQKERAIENLVSIVS